MTTVAVVVDEFYPEYKFEEAPGEKPGRYIRDGDAVYIYIELTDDELRSWQRMIAEHARWDEIIERKMNELPDMVDERTQRSET